MNGKQSVVAAGGVGLIVANFWTGPGRPAIVGGLFDKNGDPAAAHAQIKMLGGELLFVAVAALLAGISDGWGSAMAVLVVALFVLWAINRYGKDH